FRRPRLGVAVLDQQPALPRVPCLPLVVDPDERPAPLQLFAVERELEAAGVVALVRVLLRLPRPAVPQEHRAPAVLALGDDALERAVLDGMILDVHREAPIERVEA